jgi:hypothetical protein
MKCEFEYSTKIHRCFKFEYYRMMITDNLHEDIHSLLVRISRANNTTFTGAKNAPQMYRTMQHSLGPILYPLSLILFEITKQKRRTQQHCYAMHIFPDVLNFWYCIPYYDIYCHPSESYNALRWRWMLSICLLVYTLYTAFHTSTD